MNNREAGIQIGSPPCLLQCYYQRQIYSYLSELYRRASFSDLKLVAVLIYSDAIQIDEHVQYMNSPGEF